VDADVDTLHIEIVACANEISDGSRNDARWAK
jgi:hypothetical protein